MRVWVIAGILVVAALSVISWLVWRPRMVGMPVSAALADVQFTVAPDSQFAPGQIWTYRTRPNEESSTVRILRVEDAGALGLVVHVAVEGLAIQKAKAPGGRIDRAAHLPFARHAIAQSVKELQGVAPVPEHAEGYGEWRKAVEAGQGGIFTLGVAEVVALLEPRP